MTNGNTKRSNHYGWDLQVNHKRHKIAYPLCQICSTFNLTRAVTTTDHITPMQLGGARLDWNNLQSLCDYHDKEKTAYDRRQILQAVEHYISFTSWTHPHKNKKGNNKYKID